MPRDLEQLDDAELDLIRDRAEWLLRQAVLFASSAIIPDPTRRVDLSGQTFGKVRVLWSVPHRLPCGAAAVLWIGRCSCGNTVRAPAWKFTAGRRGSCRPCSNRATNAGRAMRLGGRTLKEIASAAGVSWKTVHGRLQRGVPLALLGEPNHQGRKPQRRAA